MNISQRTLSSTEEAVLKNDLLDVQDWVDKAIDGKVNNCKKRMIAEWLPKLYADESVTQIPANEDDMIALVVARSDYLNRVEREQGYPEGDPSDSWTLAQLQKYCDSRSIEHYPEAIAAVEAVEAVEAVAEEVDEDGNVITEAVEAVEGVEGVEAKSKDTKASLLAAIDEASE